MIIECDIPVFFSLVFSLIGIGMWIGKTLCNKQWIPNKKYPYFRKSYKGKLYHVMEDKPEFKDVFNKYFHWDE